MKIEPPANPLTGVGTAKVTTERTTVSVSNADGSDTSVEFVSGGDDDGVSASPLSSEMRSLQAALAQSGSADIDVAKVAAIKTAIANGQFSINADQIAAGLIATAQELLSTQSNS